MLRKYPKLFQDPQIDYPINNFNLSFSDYIQQSKNIIANTRQDLQQHAEWTIEANAPFELQPAIPSKYGALLIHGLLDSPFIMRDIGTYLQSQGMLVRSIMLPGHGTVPGALLHTDYTTWQQAVDYGVAALKSTVEKIFLVGFSTGANLSLCSAIKDPSVAGIVMIAPAFKINSHFTFLSHWNRFLPGKRTKWFYLDDEVDYVKYQSITFNSIYQVDRLASVIQNIDINQLSHCPLLMVLSEEDEIICSHAAMNYFQKGSNAQNRLLLYSGKPIIFPDKRITVRNSSYSEMGILNFSHITLPIAPSNVHYGKNGDYCFASRLEKNVRYGAFDKSDMFFYKKLQQFHLTKYRHERLTFNPDFEFMQKTISDFIFSV